MADTQTAPQPAAPEPLPELPGSVREAQEALLGLIDSEEKSQRINLKLRKHNLPKKKSLNPKRKMNHLRRNLKRKKKPKRRRKNLKNRKVKKKRNSTQSP